MILPFKKLLLICAVSFPYSCGSERGLEFDEIAGFQPLTEVRDHAAIDLDNALIESLLDDARFEEAMQVYTNGAFSRSYAELKFGFQGLPADIEVHSPVTGETRGGIPLKGMLLEHGKRGDKIVRILYNHNENQFACYVGGHPEPVYDGCFRPSGKIHFEHFDKNLTYTYNQHRDNKNDRVLQWFSTHAKSKMKPCSNCQYFKEFDRFYEFYGKVDYADRWIRAAFDGGRTVFDSSTAEFNDFDFDARAAAINKAIVTMSFTMYIIREMEEAITQCKKPCGKEGCSEKAVGAADAAAAMYIGSLEGIDGSGDGKLLYELADTECREFKTCGQNSDKTRGTSKANIEIIRGFQEMQTNLTNKACPEARLHKDQITRWMTVPLIQGTLRFAYIRSANKDISNVDKAIGAAYAASVVPLVAACSFKDAEIIGDNMETTAASTDFAMVKEAFERHYSCLGIKCKDIGGYWDKHSHKYFYMADPCSFDVTEDEIFAEEKKHKKALGWAIGVPLFTVALILVVVRRRRAQAKKRRREMGGDSEDFSDSSSDDGFII